MGLHTCRAICWNALPTEHCTANSFLSTHPCSLQLPSFLPCLLNLYQVKLISRLLSSGSRPAGPAQCVFGRDSKAVPCCLPGPRAGSAPKRCSENIFEMQNKGETPKRNRYGKCIHYSLDPKCPQLSRAIPPQMCLISSEISPRSSHVKDSVPHADRGGTSGNGVTRALTPPTAQPMINPQFQWKQ